MTDRLAHDPTGLLLAGTHDPARGRLESCVRRVYRLAHRASIEHFHAELLGLTDARGALVGVVGASSASLGPLFLEAYLDRPVEELLSEHLGQGKRQPLGRDGLAEVGNLAAARPGTATALVTTLAHRLIEEGKRHAVFTATASTRRVFRRLGAPLLCLAPADGRLLGDDLVNWGRYYECDPIVCAMDLQRFVNQAALVPGLSARLGPLWVAAAGSSLRISA